MSGVSEVFMFCAKSSSPLLFPFLEIVFPNPWHSAFPHRRADMFSFGGFESGFIVFVFVVRVCST